MRKVSRKDEISIKLLTPDSIQRRLERFNNLDIKPKTKAKVGKLLPWFYSLENQKVDTKVLLKRIYNDIDYYMENEIAPHTVCTKGCAYCCKIPVQVSLLEADYIASKGKIKLNKRVEWRYEMPTSVDSCWFLLSFFRYRFGNVLHL